MGHRLKPAELATGAGRNQAPPVGLPGVFAPSRPWRPLRRWRDDRSRVNHPAAKPAPNSSNWNNRSAMEQLRRACHIKYSPIKPEYSTA